jgi:LacI family transcriptional regulator
MKTKNLTMKDVADKAGVSITTVSHVINKTRRVNQETEDSVLRVIQELKYQSSKSQRTRAKKTIYIGVIIADIREDYYIAILKAIETLADDFGVSIIFCDSEMDPKKEEKNIDMLLNRNVRGLVIAPIESEHIPRGLRKVSVPVVLIDRQYESHHFLFIGINNFKSSYMGTKYLAEKNCKNIGFIGYTDSVYTIKQRILGYKACIMDLNQPANVKVLSLSYSKEDSYPLIKNFIEGEHIDGIICATSTVCYEVLTVIDTLSKEIQQKLKIISYDDNRWLDYLKYPVSVISQPIAEIGNASLENLLQMIEQSNYAGGGMKRELLFDTSIIDRLK